MLQVQFLRCPENLFRLRIYLHQYGYLERDNILVDKKNDRKPLLSGHITKLKLKKEPVFYNIPVDKNGFHNHISAEVAGFILDSEVRKTNEFGDVLIEVKSIYSSDNDTKKKIRNYLVEEKGVFPTAINIQRY